MMTVQVTKASCCLTRCHRGVMHKYALCVLLFRVFAFVRFSPLTCWPTDKPNAFLLSAQIPAKHQCKCNLAHAHKSTTPRFTQTYTALLASTLKNDKSGLHATTVMFLNQHLPFEAELLTNTELGIKKQTIAGASHSCCFVVWLVVKSPSWFYYCS